MMQRLIWTGKSFIRSFVVCLIGGILALIILSLTGCMSTEKATNYLKKQGKLAELCANEYPVMPEPPDTSVNQRPTVPDDVLAALEARYAEALRKLGYLENLPPVIDSSTCQQLRRQYLHEVGSLSQQIVTLKEKLRQLRAYDTLIKKTKIDSARIVALRESAMRDAAAYARQLADKDKQLADKDKALQKARADADEWQAKAKRRGATLRKIYIGAGTIGLLLFGLLWLRRKKKLLNTLNPLAWLR